jgi:hypothetical protein
MTRVTFPVHIAYARSAPEYADEDLDEAGEPKVGAIPKPGRIIFMAGESPKAAADELVGNYDVEEGSEVRAFTINIDADDPAAPKVETTVPSGTGINITVE